jgi:hypothetical protein
MSLARLRGASPPTPADIASVVKSGTDIQITWNAAAFSESDELWRSTNAGPYSMLSDALTGGYYEELGEANFDNIGVTFNYKYKRCNPGGCSSFSAVKSLLIVP